jgi:transglutaminase-like putative cysteine protease
MCMKKLVFSLFLVLFVADIFGQIYPFDSIPGNLKRRADAVIRSEQCLYRIIKPGNVIVRVKKAVTLLSDNAKNYRLLTVYYDKFSKVSSIKGAVYNEKGEMIKTLGILDVYDMSAITGGTFYSDDRMKVLLFPVYKYPYTIEYEYEEEYTSLINYPSWSFQDSPDVSVEKSGIQFLVPAGMKLRHYEENLKHVADSVLIPGGTIYTWQEENIPAVPKQQYFVKNVYNLPVLHTAPLDFIYGGFRGSMSSWKSFGDWIYNINKGRDLLPESEISKVSEIAAKSADPREKVKLIYEYMQSRTRYVSIQLGIGGFRPAEAAAVAQNGFGDCKALVNYTMALLNAVKINSFYTLVLAGEQNDINNGFVDNQFNHIILCVPMKNDSVWLDCTSQTLPFNYLGSFSCDRYALLITPEGGRMVRTPSFKKAENMVNKTGSIFLNVLGTSSGRITNYFSGYYYGLASSLLEKESEQEMKDYLSRSLRFSEYNISSVSFKEDKKEKPTATFDYELTVNNFATKSGERIFFTPSVTKTEYLQDFPSALKIMESQISSDSISYNLPLGYKVEFVPANVAINSEFGKFRYSLEVKNDKVIYRRYLEMTKGIIPLDQYNDFRSFINSVAKADRQNIILAKGTV